MPVKSFSKIIHRADKAPGGEWLIDNFQEREQHVYGTDRRNIQHVSRNVCKPVRVAKTNETNES